MTVIDLITNGGEQIWDWGEVAPWIDLHQSKQQQIFIWDAAHLRIACTADRVLAARDALMSEPDEEVREEFERLLEDA